MTENLSLLQKLLKIQNELKAPKGQYNSYSNFNYRSLEDINEAVKPLNEKYGVLIQITDKIEVIGDRFYVVATVTAYDVDDHTQSLRVQGFAREEATKKGMDGAQITGAASSYARKYAMNAMFLIDDTKDFDTNEHHNQVNNAPQNNYQQYNNQAQDRVQPQYNQQDNQQMQKEFNRARTDYFTRIHNLTGLSSDEITQIVQNKLGATDLSNYDPGQQIGAMKEVLNDAKVFAQQKAGNQ